MGTGMVVHQGSKETLAGPETVDLADKSWALTSTSPTSG